MATNPIFLSTGWMFAQSETLQQLQQYHSDFQSLVDGYELHPTSNSRVQAYDNIRLPVDFNYSIHSTPTQSPTEIESLINRANPTFIIYHPESELCSQEIVDFFSRTDITPILENLDGSHSQKQSDELLSSHFSDSFGVVLDVQHIYEHDKTMQYGFQLVEKYADSLAELHISGTINGSNHELVHRSDNKERIASFIRDVVQEHPDIPLVIEGKYESIEDVSAEVSFIRGLVEKTESS